MKKVLFGKVYGNDKYVGVSFIDGERAWSWKTDRELTDFIGKRVKITIEETKDGKAKDN